MSKEAMKDAAKAISALREWIEAVPDDVQLPSMPGVSADWLDQVESNLQIQLAEQPAQQEPVVWIWKYANGEEEVVFVPPRHVDATHVDAPSTITPLYTSPAQRKPLTADMFWDKDDAETPYDSIEEFLNHEICNGYLEVGAVFTLLQAKRFPSVKIKVTSIDENECEAEYEIIEAAHNIKENT